MEECKRIKINDCHIQICIDLLLNLSLSKFSPVQKHCWQMCVHLNQEESGQKRHCIGFTRDEQELEVGLGLKG